MKYAFILYSGITALIMAPLFAPGLIFTLDMVWGPTIDLADHTRYGASSSLPLTALFWLFNQVLPLEIIQKLLLSSIFVISGISCYALARIYMPHIPALAAGLLYLMNPYVFERFTVGHWYVHLGYALFPFVVLVFRRFLQNPTNKNFLQFSLLFAVYPIASIHWTYISFFFLVFVALLYALKGRITLHALISWQTIHKSIVLLGLFFAINSFWLFGFFEHNRIIEQITFSDFGAFQTMPDEQLGVFFNVASLYGMEYTHHLVPKDFSSHWWFVPLLVFGLSLISMWYVLRYARDRLILVAAIFVYLPALLLSVGYGSTYTRPIIEFLYSYLPLFGGLRDTAKIIGILAFSYALLVPLSLTLVRQKTLRRLGYVLVLTIPFLWSGTLLWGAYGQIKPYPYPDDWYTVNDILIKDETTTLVLALPWHQYATLNFAGNVHAAHPAQAFFTSPILLSKSTENIFLLEREKSTLDIAIINMVQGSQSFDEHLSLIERHNISHVFLAKIDDWERYQPFLDSADSLDLVFEGEYSLLYQVH